MKLKKINENLQLALQENGLIEANVMQQETFSTLKSGADCIIIAPEGTGKSTTCSCSGIKISRTIRYGYKSRFARLYRFGLAGIARVILLIVNHFCCVKHSI